MRILEELGQHQGSDAMRESRLGASTRAGSLDEGGFRGSRGFTPGRSEFTQSQAGLGVGSISNARVAKYQNVVERLNKYRIDSTPFALASAFGDSVKTAVLSPGAATSEGPQGSQDISDCWQALSYLVGEVDVQEGEFKGVAVRERQYASAYEGVETQRASDREKRDLRKTLIAGALAFLNRHLSNHVESRIAANPVKAQLGGRPNTVSKIVAFERATFTDREGKWSSDLETISTSSGTVPAWSTIFYLLCSGNAQSALDFITENDQAFRKLDGSAAAAGGGFLSFFKAWLDSPDGSLPKLLRDRFVAEYNSRFRGSGLLSSDTGSIDVYKQSLYRLIGRIDVNKSFPSAVTKDTETWLWLQLSLVREGGSDEADMGGDSLRDQFTLQDLGTKIDKFGEDHFDAKGSRPLHYFMLLLLCSQFEKAIGFLYSRPQYQVDAVNFAVALTYYGLLRVPAQSKTSHIDYVSSYMDNSTGQQIVTIDFAKLIQKYIRLFTKADAKGALQYVYLVCLNSDARRPIGEEQTKRCHDLIRALVVESRQYFELLGDIGNDGTKTAGLIEQNLRLIRLQDSRDFLSNIVGAAAVQSENENRTRDAILLYNIAEEYDRVIDVVNRELSSSLVQPADPRSNNGGSVDVTASAQAATSLAAVEDIAQLASAILDNYEKHNHIQRAVSPRKREVCRILLTLKTCFQLFSKSEWEKTLNILESLDLIPFKGDVVTITRKAESFKDVDDNVSKNFSEILLLAMTCISKLYLSLKDTPFGDASRQQVSSKHATVNHFPPLTFSFPSLFPAHGRVPQQSESPDALCRHAASPNRAQHLQPADPSRCIPALSN
jgi:nuclear pore complex protein Nup93